MKKVSILSLVALFAVIAYSFKGEEYETLKPGSKAPMVNYEMMGIDGKSYSLKSLAGENGMLVVFSCNTCPFVVAWENRYPEIAKLAAKNEIGFALINSNEAKRSGEDSMDEMKAHAEEKGYADVPYLVDENSKLANAFGGKTTPHVFLFNGNMKLVYEGAIDDNFKDASAVEKTYLKDAIKNLVSGDEINPNDTKAIGCSIKRVKS